MTAAEARSLSELSLLSDQKTRDVLEIIEKRMLSGTEAGFLSITCTFGDFDSIHAGYNDIRAAQSVLDARGFKTNITTGRPSTQQNTLKISW